VTDNGRDLTAVAAVDPVDLLDTPPVALDETRIERVAFVER